MNFVICYEDNDLFVNDVWQSIHAFYKLNS